MGITAVDYLKQNFTASKPNKKWVTSITEFKVHEQKIYLSLIIDLYNQEVVVWNFKHSVGLRGRLQKLNFITLFVTKLLFYIR